MILDDAVLHHSQLTSAIEVGVGVHFFWLAVGGPAGVTDPACALRTTGLKTRCKVHELAFCSQTGEPGPMHCGDTSGVVTAVLQLAQSIEQQWGRLPGPNYRNDAAHTNNPLNAKKPGRAGLSIGMKFPETAVLKRNFSTPNPSNGWFHHPDRREC